jgi:hypothetical protein
MLYGTRGCVIECRRGHQLQLPHCNQQLAVDQAGAGMTVNCPSCNEQIELPDGIASQVLKVPLPAAPPTNQIPERA